MNVHYVQINGKQSTLNSRPRWHGSDLIFHFVGMPRENKGVQRSPEIDFRDEEERERERESKSTSSQPSWDMWY
jgi:hypothetical protein